MNNSVKQILQDNDGNLSSKRTITFISIFLMVLITVSDLFWDFKVESNIFDSIMWIVISGLGTSTLEKFASAWKDKPKETKQQPPQEKELLRG